MALRARKFQQSLPIVDSQGRPTPEFLRVLNEQVDIVNAILAVTTLANSAQSAANAAQATATASARELARINSYTAPTSVLSASDNGADARITVIAHTRVYPVQGTIDVPDVSIAGPVNLNGLAFSTQYAVYYDDTTLADTTPTYQATTTLADAQVGAAPGRHFVGVVTTPADGGGGTTGGGGSPPGGGGGFPIP